MKTILHVSIQSKWNVAVSNCINLKQLEPEAIIEIVVNSVAIKVFESISEALLSQLNHLTSLGVSVILCRNALTANHILEDSLPTCVKVVPAGILELIQKQQAGYFYIKP